MAKIKEDLFKKRMRRLVSEIEKSGLGHEPPTTRYVLAQIDGWSYIDPILLYLLFDPGIPEPINTIISHDPGYRTAISILFGETEFCLCDDCRCPMDKFDKKKGIVPCVAIPSPINEKSF